MFWRKLAAKLLATQKIDQLIANAGHEKGFKKTLSAFDLTLLGVGCIIGTGIFVLSGRAAAANAGPAVCLSFLIGAVVAAAAALCYAEMASMIPVAGSAYTYAYATVGELIAFLIGWDLVLEYLLGAATVSVGWSGYFVTFLKTLNLQLPPAWLQAPYSWDAATAHFIPTNAIVNLPASLAVLVITMVLIRGTQESARFNSLAVMVKLLVIVLFVVFCAPFIRYQNFVPFIPANSGVFGHFGISGLFQGASMVFFSYVGFDAVCTAAQETQKPQRDLPIAIIASLLIAAITYVAVSATLVGVVPYTQLGVADPIAVGVEHTGLLWLSKLVEVGAIFGLGSVLLVMLMAQPRIFYAMARDGLFFAAAEKLHPRFGTPYVMTIWCGLLCALCGGFLPIDLLGQLSSIGTLLAFALVAVGIIVLRWQKPEYPRPFRVPGPAWGLPLLALFSSITLMLTTTRETLLGLLLWMTLGIVFYFSYSLQHAKLRQNNLH